MASNPVITSVSAPEASLHDQVGRYLRSLSPFQEKLSRAGEERFSLGLQAEPIGQAGHHRFSSLTRSGWGSGDGDRAAEPEWARDFARDGALPLPHREARVGKDDEWKAYESMSPDRAERMHARKMRRRDNKNMRLGPDQPLEADDRFPAAGAQQPAGPSAVDKKAEEKKKKLEEANAIMAQYRSKNVHGNRLTLQRKLPKGKGLFARGIASAQIQVPISIPGRQAFDEEAFLTKNRDELHSPATSPSIHWKKPRNGVNEASGQLIPLPANANHRRYAPGELPPPGRTGSPSWPTVSRSSRGRAQRRVVGVVTPFPPRSRGSARTQSMPIYVRQHAGPPRSNKGSPAPTGHHLTPTGAPGRRKAYGQVITGDMLPCAPFDSLVNEEMSFRWHVPDQHARSEAGFTTVHEPHPLNMPGRPESRLVYSPAEDLRLSGRALVSPVPLAPPPWDESPVLRPVDLLDNPFILPNDEPVFVEPAWLLVKQEPPEELPTAELVLRMPAYGGHASHTAPLNHTPDASYGHLECSTRQLEHGSAFLARHNYYPAGSRIEATPLGLDGHPVAERQILSTPHRAYGEPVSPASPPQTTRTKSDEQVERYGATHVEYRKLWTGRSNLL